MRPWKVNTVLSLDGFKVCISGASGGGKSLRAQPMMQFSSEIKWQWYLKKLESFAEKIQTNPNYIHDSKYDKVTAEDNTVLYDLYINKFKASFYSKRVNNPITTLESGRERFLGLGIYEQSVALLNIHQLFGRIAGGCDLTLVGGSANTGATVNFSSTISNWKKLYKKVTIVDSSTSGLWNKESENLLLLI